MYYPIFDEALPCLDKLEAVGKLVAELVATGTSCSSTAEWGSTARTS